MSVYNRRKFLSRMVGAVATVALGESLFATGCGESGKENYDQGRRPADYPVSERPQQSNDTLTLNPHSSCLHERHYYDVIYKGAPDMLNQEFNEPPREYISKIDPEIVGERRYFRIFRTEGVEEYFPSLAIHTSDVTELYVLQRDADGCILFQYADAAGHGKRFILTIRSELFPRSKIEAFAELDRQYPRQKDI